MGRVEDKLVVITAAGQGIGRASALLLAREGATVIATDIREDLLEELAEVAKTENLKITVKRVDVTTKSDILALAEGLEKVDVLFNCAGFVFFFSLDSVFSPLTSDMSTREVFLTAVMRCLKGA